MVITVEEDVSRIERLPNLRLRCVGLRAESLARLYPLSVQIEARETAPVITDHHAVWIEHRNHLDDVVVAEVPRALVV